MVFDGECGFCVRSIRLGRSLDWLGRIEWVPRADSALRARYPLLNEADSANRMLSIRPDGTVLGGFRAVRDIGLQCPLTFLPCLILYLPGADRLGDPLYRWIARNRHRLGSASCSLKEQGPRAGR